MVSRFHNSLISYISLFFIRLVVLGSVFIIVFQLLYLSACNNTNPSDGVYGYWQVDSIENRNSTGNSSEPWIKISQDD